MIKTNTNTKTANHAVTLLKEAPIIDMGNGLGIPQVTYKGQPVLTARAIAEVLGCDVKAVQDNYRNNRRHFYAGKHIHILNVTEAKAMGLSHVAAKIDLKISGLNFFRYSGSGVALFTREGVAPAGNHGGNR